jgi:sec-independent protein translocase protein TatB
MGLSFGEIVVLAVIALVVIGPKDLPRLLRSAGRMIGQAKRAISDVKRETGLDEVLRGDFQDLERLADHIEDLGPYRGDDAQKRLGVAEIDAFRAREYPLIGADSAGLLPEDSDVYADAQTFSPEGPEGERVPDSPAPIAADRASREGAHT